MVNYYKTVNDSLLKVNSPEDDTWISLLNPSEDEVNDVAKAYDIDINDMRSALDKDERSRIEIEDNYTMVLVNIPTVQVQSDKELYDTIPLAVFIIKKHVITVCTEETPILSAFVSARVKTFNTAYKSQFVLRLLYRTASTYLTYLREIDKKSDALEAKMHSSTRNSELMELLKLEKSLLYFTTALRSNEAVMEKLFKSPFIKRFPEDEDLLDDVIVENKQAIEMANIYSGVLSSMVDAFASMISNNLNVAMKILAIITLVMSIPTIIFSAYGMNVAGIPLASHPHGFMIVSVVSCVISLVVLWVMANIKSLK
ncbi:MAG: magnesium transporter CorA family protein [Lachnospiraceae bacterium]|nr:magnesium transporter CorA family protein [Lachnospiraceae bacterium]